MSELRKPKDSKVLQHWCDTTLKEGKDLSAWEKSFLQSIQSQLMSGRVLSFAQEDKLESIYASKTA